MSRQVCKDIIDGLGDAQSSAIKAIGNLNDVRFEGVTPTDDEALVLLNVSEQLTKACRTVVQAWLARIPLRKE